MFLARYSKLYLLIVFLLCIVSCANPITRQNTTEKPIKEVITAKAETIDNTQVTPYQPPQTSKTELPSADIERSIWEKIDAGFMLPDLEHPSIDRELARLLKHPTLLKQNIESALPFLSYVIAKTETRKIPAELALIPFIESNYELRAKSSSNAKGLWQFMPSTARSLGLQHTSWREDSYNPVLSTDAALDYFTENNQRFEDWILSIAAYNGGPTKISRELATAEDSNTPHVFFSLDLSPETRNYLPKLLAYKKLFADYKNRPEIFNPAPKFDKFAKVTITEQTSFAVLAAIAKIDKQKITHYNPGYTSWSTPPNADAVLLLPEKSASLLKQKEKYLSQKQRLPWIEYRIKSGDSLGLIASAHKTSISMIKKLNSLASDKIYAGQLIKIPAHKVGS
jgi:membrane-bound lytic murein transglycosylase D